MPAPREAGVDRRLAFSDGVFAIAITLLALNLHEPTVSRGLLAALLQAWPAYLGYALSFLIVGIVWARRHWMFRVIRCTDHPFLLIDVVFLLWVAVLPFPTAILATYRENPGERQTATAVYAGVFLVGGVPVNLQWLYASHRDRLLVADVDRALVRTMTWSVVAGPVLWLVAFALAFVSPPARIALIVLVNLFFAVSPLLPLDRWLG